MSFSKGESDLITCDCSSIISCSNYSKSLDNNYGENIKKKKKNSLWLFLNQLVTNINDYQLDKSFNP